MENNIAKWLKECNNPAKEPMTKEFTKGMQPFKAVQPKPLPVQAQKEVKAITSTQDILNNSLDVNFLDKELEELLKHYEPSFEMDSREVVKAPVAAEENISFHLLEENKESFQKRAQAFEYPKTKDNKPLMISTKEQLDSVESHSKCSETIKLDSEDVDDCLREFDCFFNGELIKNELPKIEEVRNENEMSGSDINELLRLQEEEDKKDSNYHKVNEPLSNVKSIKNNQKSSSKSENPFLEYSQSAFKHGDPVEASFVERSCFNHQLADLNEWSKSTQWDEEVEMVNLQVFGFKTFRPNQREIINANLAGRDIFVCMPTGGGKSLTFQIPAIIQFGVTLVVMPLLSLIQDQTSFLSGVGINAIFLNADGMREVLSNYDTLFHSDNEEDLCKLIFLTPEKISQSPSAQSFLQRLYKEKLLKRAVIDEAHCVSQWGREFRPDYLHLKVLKKMFPGIPILAVTATAPNKIREDVITQLGMSNTLFFRSSYNRPNLYIEIRNKKECTDLTQNIAEFIKSKYPTATGLIYCSSKKNCETLCQKLQRNHHISCAFYHASLPERKKIEIQDKWKNDQIKVIIATVAFGMGINKADVRFVIHHSMPKSFESYYQEIGRAGRDGNRSHCILYYSAADRKIIEFLMSKTNLNQQMITESLRKTTEMIEYCEESCECRRVIALLYFDEKFNRNHCHKMCDNCKKGLQPEETDVTDNCVTVLSLLKAAHMEGVEFTSSSLVDYLRGLKRKMKKHPRNTTYFSMMKNVKDADLRKIIRRLIIWKYIDECLMCVGAQNVYSRLEISSEGRSYLNSIEKPKLIVPFVCKDRGDKANKQEEGEQKKEALSKGPKEKEERNNSKPPHMMESNNKEAQVEVEEDKETDSKPKTNCTTTRPRRYQPNYEKENLNDGNEFYNKDEDYGYCTPIQFYDLFSQLKIKRMELFSAEKRRLINLSTDGNIKLTLNDIFTENGLKELCRKLPTNESELSPENIFGVNTKSLEKYGKEFLYTIQKVIKIYQIEKSQERVSHNMRNIDSSRMKQAKRSGNKKEQSPIDVKSIKQPKEKPIIEKESSDVVDQPFCFNDADLQELLIKANEPEDYEGFNSFNNCENLEESNKEPIDEEVVQREEMLSLCKDAKKLFRNEKKRKSDEMECDCDSKEERPQKVAKIDGRSQYFKNKAKWAKINAYKKKKFL